MPGRQQHHLRIAHAGAARSPPSRDAAAGRTRPRRARAARHQVGQHAQRHVPVLDHVGDARWRAGVVLQHQEAPGLVADDVGAADMHIGAVRRIEADHRLAVGRVAQHQFARHDAVLQDLPVVIDVVQEQVQRAHALDDAGFQRAPFLRGDHARDQVERQDAVDRGGVGIDGEGDAALQQVALGIGGAAAQCLDRQMAQPFAQQRQRGMGRLARPQHLAEQAARIVAPPERRPAASVAPDRIRRVTAQTLHVLCRPATAIATSADRSVPNPRPAAARSAGNRLSAGRSTRAPRRPTPPQRRAVRTRRSQSSRSSSRPARRRRASRCCWTVTFIPITVPRTCSGMSLERCHQRRARDRVEEHVAEAECDRRLHIGLPAEQRRARRPRRSASPRRRSTRRSGSRSASWPPSSVPTMLPIANTPSGNATSLSDSP